MPLPATHPALALALDRQGYAEPTPVQAAVLEPEAAGRDLLVSAQTGSGKTVAFGLAMGPDLLGEAERFGPAGAPLALVVAPTRELAQQVTRELSWLYAPAGAAIGSCVGGMDPRAEQRALAAGRHLVVGTPGRLRDHIERGRLDLSALQVVVLDEADEMLDLGFREDLEFILDATPAERRTLLFSATLARDIVALARRYQADALRIDTTRRDQPHGDIEYRALRVAPNDVEHAVVNVLRFFESPGALVFCNTRAAVTRLHLALRERGFEAVALSGELTQRDRSEALQALRDGRARVCVATDVAARGIDLPDLGLVIHAELPVNRAGLLHRSGRTGRAGKKGVSVLLVSHTRRRKAEQLLASAGVEATWAGPPSADEIRGRDRARLLETLTAVEPAAEDELELAREVLARRSPEDVAAALIRLHRTKLPAPEDLLDDVRFRDAQATPLRPRGKDRFERPERMDYAAGGDAAWFRMAVGRSQNADPKWLVPLICRLGHVTKKDIGAIRIFDRETKFEITREAESRFREALKGAGEGEVKVEPAAAPPAPGPRPKGAPPKGRPGAKPWANKPGAEGGYDPARPRPKFKGKDKGKPRHRARAQG